MPHPERASDAVLGSADGVGCCGRCCAAADGPVSSRAVIPAFLSTSARDAELAPRRVAMPLRSP